MWSILKKLCTTLFSSEEIHAVRFVDLHEIEMCRPEDPISFFLAQAKVESLSYFEAKMEDVLVLCGKFESFEDTDSILVKDRNLHSEQTCSSAYIREGCEILIFRRTFYDARWIAVNSGARLTPDNSTVNFRKFGAFLSGKSISSLKWEHSDEDASTTAETLVSVEAVGLNFKDVLSMTSMLKSHDSFGLEFSGFFNGKRVMVVGQNSFCTKKIFEKERAFLVPSKWSFQDSCTVLVSFGTAYLSLFLKGGLKPGQSILIHSAAGALGLAALHICTRRGLKVFATCGKSKKERLMKLFPQLSEDDIFDSRTVEFENLLLERTKKKGVDAVLNCLSGHLFDASIRVLAFGGCFLQVSKTDQEKPLLHLLNKCASFHAIDFCKTMEDMETWRLLRREILLGIEVGEVQPLPFEEFLAKDVRNAFLRLASGNSFGKIVINLHGLK